MAYAKRTTKRLIEQLTQMGTQIDLLERQAVATTESQARAFDALPILLKRANLISILPSSLPKSTPSLRKEEARVLRARLLAAAQDAADTIRTQSTDSFELLCLPSSAELGIPQLVALLTAREANKSRSSVSTDRRAR